MYVKGIGCILILAGCFYYGHLQAQKWETGVSLLEEWCQKLIFLQDEIRYAKTPLPELFKMLGNEKKQTPVTLFFTRTAEELKKGEESLERIWSKQTRMLTSKLPLDYERTRLLGQGMSRMFTHTQAEYMKGYIAQLNQKINRSRSELADRKKVIQTLSIAAGVVMVLILL